MDWCAIITGFLVFLILLPFFKTLVEEVQEYEEFLKKREKRLEERN